MISVGRGLQITHTPNRLNPTEIVSQKYRSVDKRIFSSTSNNTIMKYGFIISHSVVLESCWQLKLYVHVLNVLRIYPTCLHHSIDTASRHQRRYRHCGPEPPYLPGTISGHEVSECVLVKEARV